MSRWGLIYNLIKCRVLDKWQLCAIVGLHILTDMIVYLKSFTWKGGEAMVISRKGGEFRELKNSFNEQLCLCKQKGI